MAVSEDPTRPRLGCGRSLEDVAAEDVAVGDPSYRIVHDDCPQCADARTRFDALAASTGLLAAPDPPPGLTAQIMAAVRVELRRGATLALPRPEDESGLGPLHVAEAAVAAVVRTAADRVPGARARSCRILPDPDRPGSVHVQLGVALRAAAGPTQAVPDAVRAEVREALRRRVGLEAAVIDIRVVDLWGLQ